MPTSERPLLPSAQDISKCRNSLGRANVAADAKLIADPNIECRRKCADIIDAMILP